MKAEDELPVREKAIAVTEFFCLDELNPL